MITKPVRNPAKYNSLVLDTIAQMVNGYYTVLDPFAGTGKIHALFPKHFTVGIELEPEWAHQHPRTMVGNALHLLFPANSFDAVCTSPTYGNRLADHHDAKDASRRNTYTHALGRKLHPDNSGSLHWGPKYQTFHRRAWIQVRRVLKPGGIFILNISDHVKNGAIVPVTDWHISTLTTMGFETIEAVRIDTPRLRFGANRDLRAEYESVLKFLYQPT